MITIACANALNIPLPDRSVQCAVTSPPYWGLRDYGVSDQIGLERTPAEYVAHIVAVMRECWRVLKDDGTCWLNLGDSYMSNGQSQNAPGGDVGQRGMRQGNATRPPRVAGLKPKDLVGIPWRVAFALQDAGWYLRQDIIWSKKNCMPESVTDRCTKSHEYIFLLTKSPRYFYDNIAIQEVDTEAIKDYNAEYENQAVYQMQEGSTYSEFLESEEGEGRPVRLVQGMLFGEREGMGADTTGETFEEDGRPEIQGERTRQEKENRIQSLGKDEQNQKEVAENRSGTRVSKEVSVIGEAKSGIEEIFSDKEIQGNTQKVSGNGQGTREFIEGSTQEEGELRNYSVRSDGGTMGRNQAETGLSLCDMWEEETADEGSRYPAEQGRTAYSEEHSGSMPIMQQQKGKQVIRSRNKRSVWHIATQPFSGSHFATFPPALIEPMILAGTSARGECPHCGKAWVRVVENGLTAHDGKTESAYAEGTTAHRMSLLRQAARERGEEYTNGKVTTGWRPACTCPTHEPIPQTVLDPFAGSGTTGAVAVKHGRKAVLLDLSTKYIDLQFERTNGVQMMMAT